MSGLFVGIAPGEEVSFPGLRVVIASSSDRAYIGGKWFDLGQDHAVVLIQPGSKAEFIKQNGERRVLGSFPAWVARGRGSRPAICIMTNIGQFRGGWVRTIDRAGKSVEIGIPAA